MKTILITAFLLVCTSISAQDTLYIMIRLNEVVYFDNSTMEIFDRHDNAGDFQIRVEEEEVLLLHLFDKEKYYRDVTMTFSDSLITHNTYESMSELLYTSDTWPAFVVDVSEPRREGSVEKKFIVE